MMALQPQEVGTSWYVFEKCTTFIKIIVYKNGIYQHVDYLREKLYFGVLVTDEPLGSIKAGEFLDHVCNCFSPQERFCCIRLSLW